jgi:hypothetical protein
MRRLALLVVAAAASVGCSKPAVGDACARGKATCLDTTTELQCETGKFVSAPCRGAKGCAVVDNVQTCDISGNAQGDVCSTDDEGVSQCAPGGATRVVCRSGRYLVEPCRGPRACAEQGDDVACDQSVAAEGDECVGEERQVCSADRKALLVCTSGKLSIAEFCRGPSRCSPDAGVLCDRGHQRPADPCGNEGEVACGGEADKETLACESKRWVVRETPPGKRCPR